MKISIKIECNIICKMKNTINNTSILFKEEWNSSCIIVLLSCNPMCIEGYAINIKSIIFLVWEKLSSYSEMTVKVKVEFVSLNWTRENNSVI